MSDQPERDKPNQPITPPARRRPTHDLIDQIIAKAQADGMFDNLPGQGQPLRLENDDMVPEEDRLGMRMLKTAGFVPPWAEAQRTIDENRARLEEWLANANRRWTHLAPAGRAALEVAYKRKLTEHQSLILNFNLSAPPGVAHLEGLRMAEELARLGV